jgi:hypothetical protein
MNNVFTLVVMAGFLSATAAFSSEGMRVKNWNNVQTYDVAALQKDSLPRKLQRTPTTSARPNGERRFVRQRDYHLVNKIFPSSGS